MRVPFLLCRRLVAPGNGIVRQPDRGCSLGGAERPRCGEERRFFVPAPRRGAFCLPRPGGAGEGRPAGRGVG